MTKEKTTKTEFTKISYKNDVFFKFALCGEDQASCWIRKFIIKSVFGLEVFSTTVLNPEILPKSIIGKRVILDILCKDDKGQYSDIEMQVSGYTRNEQLRIQEYGYHLAGRQLKKGDEYVQLKPFYQIIFISASPLYDEQLVQHFKVKDDNNIEEPCGTLNRAIVFLKVINKIAKKKGYHNLTEFEKFCYILENNDEGDILETESKAVRLIVEKHLEMKNNEDWWSWADAAERYERAERARREEELTLREEAKEQGLAEGLAEGKFHGKFELIDMVLKHKYGGDHADWLQSLNESQLDEIIIRSYSCKTIDELKDIVKRQE